MRFLLGFMMALALTVAPPGVRAQTHAGPTQAQPDTDQRRIAMQAYVGWLQALDQLSGPMQAELDVMGREWDRAFKRTDFIGAARDFRAAMKRSATKLDAIRADIDALPMPGTPMNGIRINLDPATLKQQMLDACGSIKALLLGMPPIMDARARNDRAGAHAAGMRMYKGLGILLRTRAALLDGIAETADPNGGSREVYAFQALSVRANGQLIEAAPILATPRVNAVLAGNLDILASNADKLAESGNRLNENEITQVTASADREIKRMLPVIELSRSYYVIMRQYAVTLRALAAQFRTKPASMPALSAAMDKLGVYRPLLEDIDRKQKELLAK